MKELIERKLNVLSHEKASAWREIKKLSDEENHTLLKGQLERIDRIELKVEVLEETLIGI